jgi:hypothetical protein
MAVQAKEASGQEITALADRGYFKGEEILRCDEAGIRRIARWEHEAVLERMQARLNQRPQAARERRQTVEHPFATLKAWMGATHFLMRTLPKVRTEMSLHVLAYNMKRVISLLGTTSLIRAMQA